MCETQHDRELVERLAEEFAERYRRGERPPVSEYVVAHPQHADEIRALFPALVLLEELAPSDDGADRPPASGHAPPPERIGDYRILREIGRGGMGVVYEAEQISLERRVALKVLPLQTGGDVRVLERFRRESKAAARLHHTNIVPVFEVGQEGDVCYYAMQFIQGQALDEVLKELQRLRSGGTAEAGPVTHSLWVGQFDPPGDAVGPHPEKDSAPTERTTPSAKAPASLSGHSELSSVESNFQLYCRNVARIGLQVAEALAHAHARGIVHRDVKPSNLLLDTAGVVWVSDFGLALTEDRGLTEPGEVVGTLRYMAPERFQGTCDARADVYALGLTLYELLVLRPAFDGSDRLRLIEQISGQEPPRPRVHDPRIPRDLETVALKAMEKDASRRYQTVEEMAQDLRHFLADEPIRARRIGLLERWWRMGRRNPVVAGLGGVVAALLAVSLVVLIVATLIGQERDRAVRAEQEALVAKRENKVREHLARAAALRRSGQVGQRFQSLAEVRQALDLTPSPALRSELRGEAAAALVLADVTSAREWAGWPEDTINLACDDFLERFARLDKQGDVAIGRLVESGEEVVARWPSSVRAPFHGVWMSPDGGCVLVRHGPSRAGTDDGFTVWKLDWQRADLAPTRLFTEEAPASVWSVAFASDALHLAVECPEGRVSLFDLETGRRAWQVTVVGLRHVAFHPDGNTLAVASGAEVLLFDVATGQERKRFCHQDKSTEVVHLAWNPDGRRLATACTDCKIHIWDADAGREVMPPWKGHANYGIQMAFNHAGDRLVSTDWDRQTRLWDANSGCQLLAMPGDFGLQFSRDDTLLGPHHNGSQVRLWRVAPGRELVVIPSQSSGEGRDFIHYPVPHVEGRVLAANSQRGLCFFDLVNGEELASVPVPRPTGSAVRVFLPADGWMASAVGTTLFWPAQPDSDQPQLLCVGPPRQFARGGGSGASASPDGAVVVLAQGDSAVVLHRDRPRRSFVLQPQKDVRQTAVSPNGHWVVTCSYNPDLVASVRIWNAETGEHVHNLPRDAVSSPWFSPDGRWLAVNTRGQDCRLWEVGTWREVRRYGEALVAFSPDQRTLALDDVIGQIRFVETETDRELVRLTGPDPLWYEPACFTADGTRLIAVARDRRAIYVWDLRVIRQQLKEIGLDWDGPEFPPAPPPGRAPAVRVDPGFLRHETDFPDARQAVAVLTIALALQPVNPEAYLHRGCAFGRLKLAREAMADYSAFLALTPPEDPRRAATLFRRSNNALYLKDQATRLSDLLAMAHLDVRSIPWPGDVADACHSVARGLLVGPEKDCQPDQALELVRKAVELSPDDAMYRNTLGVACYRLGRWADAAAALEPNLAGHDEQAAFDLYILAMSYHQLGGRAKARDCFDRAVRWHEDRKGSLSAEYLAELKAFRTEAEALLKADR
jgi:serine/threonine protein kinase/WD40 repeat protein